MQQRIKIYSATRGTIEGNPYANLWAESEETLNEPDTVGRPPMKMNCAREIVDVIRTHAPAEFDCEVKMVSAGGAKGGLFVVSAKPITGPSQTPKT